MEKNCFKCGLTKTRSEFYAHHGMSDGLLGKCKSCTRADATENRKNNLERVRKYDRDRARLPHRMASSFRVSEAWRARGPAARSAQSMVHHAIRDGRLKRGTCEVCGSDMVHAHHDDYIMPLNVRWLCAAHHRQWHRDNGPGKNADAIIPPRSKNPKMRTQICA